MTYTCYIDKISSTVYISNNNIFQITISIFFIKKEYNNQP